MIVIPDVHGRIFWKQAVEAARPDEKIVFLGDYLDPYMYEFDENPDLIPLNESYEKIRDHVMNNFKEIIELKKQNPDRVVLLLGNHDCTYAISTGICDCRRDRFNQKEYEKLFDENKNLFTLVHFERVNDREYIFSHAGYHREYAVSLFGEDVEDNPLKACNELLYHWKEETYGVLDSLGRCSFYRGGYGKTGSIVWADVREWATAETVEYNAYQVFGHTQLNENPIITEDFACLDCRRGFRFEDGKFYELTGEELPVKKLS
jgi:hypothetical protein